MLLEQLSQLRRAAHVRGGRRELLPSDSFDGELPSLPRSMTSTRSGPGDRRPSRPSLLLGAGAGGRWSDGGSPPLRGGSLHATIHPQLPLHSMSRPGEVHVEEDGSLPGLGRRSGLRPLPCSPTEAHVTRLSRILTRIRQLRDSGSGQDRPVRTGFAAGIHVHVAAKAATGETLTPERCRSSLRAVVLRRGHALCVLRCRLEPSPSAERPSVATASRCRKALGARRRVRSGG